eukprot:92649_1
MDMNNLSNFVQSLGPPPDNPAEVDYNIALWTSIHQFSASMMIATNKYSKAISSRKRKSPQTSNTNTNDTQQPKKRKTSCKNSKIKLYKSPKRSMSNEDRIYKIRRPRTSW